MRSFEGHRSRLSVTANVDGAPAKAECGGDKRAEEYAQLRRTQQPLIGEGKHRDEDRHGKTDASQQADQPDVTPRNSRSKATPAQSHRAPSGADDAKRFPDD